MILLQAWHVIMHAMLLLPGLMWESAPSFEAMLVFAEHRYYGESKPFPGKTLRKHMHYLTTEQVRRGRRSWRACGRASTSDI